jgi:hypothetical protein
MTPYWSPQAGDSSTAVASAAVDSFFQGAGGMIPR